MLTIKQKAVVHNIKKISRVSSKDASMMLTQTSCKAIPNQGSMSLGAALN